MCLGYYRSSEEVPMILILDESMGVGELLWKVTDYTICYFFAKSFLPCCTCQAIENMSVRLSTNESDYWEDDIHS
jgi:hypothetical protein